MIWVFWITAALVAYTYVGYVGVLWLRATWKRRPVRRGVCQPMVSVVMVVRNEENVLEPKLRNLLEIAYPVDRREIIVVSDGSTDGTAAILRHYEGPQFRVLVNELPAGKASGLNDAIRIAQGEIVVFMDVRQKVEPQAVPLLAENFADAEVGCVSGELMLGDGAHGETSEGMAMYWQVEKKIRELESAASSVVGATGALYAARRELVVRLPKDTILDDVLIPMNVVRQGFRTVLDGRVRAWDCADLGRAREFRRKVRTLTGNYQLLRLAPWLLRGENPLRFEFISHKLTRLTVPFLLAVIWITSWMLPGELYRVLFWLQAGFYGLSLLGAGGWNLGPVSRILDAAYTFVVLNAAAAVAFVNFATGNMRVWSQPSQRNEVKA